MWECSKCGQVRARRQNSECEEGGQHDWVDKEELAEERRKDFQKRKREYNKYVKSEEGKEKLELLSKELEPTGSKIKRKNIIAIYSFWLYTFNCCNSL
jgi:hypothetical protein